MQPVQKVSLESCVHQIAFTIMCRVSPQPPPVCSIHLDDATAATGQQRQCAHHTPATGGEERESHRANQVDGEAMIDKGQWWEFGQDTGVTPLLFTRSAMGFLNDHRESGPQFNVSSVLFDSLASPSLCWGVRTHTYCRVSTPCWPH